MLSRPLGEGQSDLLRKTSLVRAIHSGCGDGCCRVWRTDGLTTLKRAGTRLNLSPLSVFPRPFFIRFPVFICTRSSHPLALTLSLVLGISSKVVQYVVKPGAHVADNLQQRLISKLKNVFLDASLHGDAKLQETAVLTIGQLGRTAEGDLLLVVVVSLLNSLTAHSQLVRAVAFEQVSSGRFEHVSGNGAGLNRLVGTGLKGALQVPVVWRPISLFVSTAR